MVTENAGPFTTLILTSTAPPFASPIPRVLGCAGAAIEPELDATGAEIEPYSAFALDANTEPLIGISFVRTVGAYTLDGELGVCVAGRVTVGAGACVCVGLYVNVGAWMGPSRV